LLTVDAICQSFGCLPTRALWELQHDPDQMVVQLLEIRAYREAKRIHGGLKDGDDYKAAVQANPLVAVVDAIDHEIAAELVAARRAQVIADAMSEDIDS